MIHCGLGKDFLANQVIWLITNYHVYIPYVYSQIIQKLVYNVFTTKTTWNIIISKMVQNVSFFFFSWWGQGSHYVTEAGLELEDSSDPPTSWIAGTPDSCCQGQLNTNSLIIVHHFCLYKYYLCSAFLTVVKTFLKILIYHRLILHKT